MKSKQHNVPRRWRCSMAVAFAGGLAACGGAGGGIDFGEGTAPEGDDDGSADAATLADAPTTGSESEGSNGDAPTSGDDGLTEDTGDVPPPTEGFGGCDEVGPDDAIPVAKRTIAVTDSDALEAALAAAEPGDEVVLGDGEYTIGRVTRSGTAEAPIVIRSATPLGATLSDGQLELDSVAWVILADVELTMGATVKVTSSHHVRITRSVFRLAEEESMKWLIVQGEDSHDNRIDHNLFEEKHELGNFITIDGSETQQSQDDRIDHNYFREIGPRADNEMEAVRIGWSAISESSGRTRLECNLFENCDGDPEIVSVKSCDNVVRNNTFLTSQGALVLRHGNGSRVEGNLFLGEGREGTGGIRIYGEDHVVVDNHLEGLTGEGYDAAMQIDGGDVDQTGALSSHFRVYRALVAFNTFVDNATGIELGANYDLPPVDVVIANNVIVGSSGPLVNPKMDPVGLVLDGNVVHPTGSATVGMSVPDEQLWAVDPRLAPIEGLSRPADDSPVIDAARGRYPSVTRDLDGDPRPDPKDVGADEVGGALRRPLGPDDVGPAGP